MTTNRQPSLPELRAFAAVVDRRSFRAAADHLDLAPSTVSHLISQLEARLGTRLLHRSTRSVAPTHAGAALAEQLGQILGALDVALSQSGNGDGAPAGLLRITASETVAVLVVRHVLPVLAERHPAISLDLVADAALVDIVAEGFDAGIRLGEAVPRDMVAARIGGESRMLPVATPAYLAASPPVAVPEDLLAHRCIRTRTPAGRAYAWHFAKDGLEKSIAVAGPVTLNRSELMIEAALSGVGVALVPERLAAPFLATGVLVTLIEQWCPSYPGLFVFYPGHRHVPPALRAFTAIAKEVLAGDLDDGGAPYGSAADRAV